MRTVRPISAAFTASASVAFWSIATLVLSVHAEQVDIQGPPGSVSFGMSVTVLPNGNFVVSDPSYASFGAVHLYSPDGMLISTLTGSSFNDNVGSRGVVIVGGGNFVVVSPYWSNGAKSSVGALTWVNGTTGLNGVVSAANSLIGTTSDDNVGSGGVTALSNGNYVVASPGWNNGVANNRFGAATWGNGAGGTTGVISSANSLVGTTANDLVGSRVTALTNGNYVVASVWNNGTPNGGFGAATWGNGASGVIGPISAANSLVGATTNAQVGIGGVIALTNGNYVVVSYRWGTGWLGAVTWGNGASGTKGAVSISNSLVGTTANDQVGNFGITALSNGNYVVASPYWKNNLGAATWGNGSVGTKGAVSTGNSLVGTTAGDAIGESGIAALNNGNYVVNSGFWYDGSAYAGAATWRNGSMAQAATVSMANSLVGNAQYSAVGSGGSFALSDGNYVVASSNGGFGAISWHDGLVGASGQLSPSNSLVGSSSDDRIGLNGVTALVDGNYLVQSSFWSNGSANARFGAATWCRKGGGTVGSVSALNSLVGTSSSDNLATSARAFSDGNYAIISSQWAHNGLAQAGAITLANGRFRLKGSIQPWNSVIGGVAYGYVGSSYDYDVARHRLVVGRSKENIVSLFTMDQLFAEDFDP